MCRTAMPGNERPMRFLKHVKSITLEYKLALNVIENKASNEISKEKRHSEMLEIILYWDVLSQEET